MISVFWLRARNGSRVRRRKPVAAGAGPQNWGAGVAGVGQLGVAILEQGSAFPVQDGIDCGNALRQAALVLGAADHIAAGSATRSGS